MTGNVLFTNQAAGELLSAIVGSDTSITLKSGQGAFFPAPTGDNYSFIVVQNETTWEVMKLTDRTGDLLTVVRAQEGTTARNFPANSVVELRVTAGLFSAIQDRIGTLETLVGALQVEAAKASFVNEIRMFSGPAEDIASIPGGVWKLCDGTNGTPDLRKRFVMGAGYLADGSAPHVGDNGGQDSVTLSTAQLPAHNHGVNDPGHGHGLTDPGHGHSVTDPGHNHSTTATGGGQGHGGTLPNTVEYGAASTGSSTTGLYVNNAYSNVSVQNGLTGISTQNTGSGASIDIRPRYYALAFIKRVA